uniref:Uncharacterized protein n=1 Tax=Strongyloides venezuelensis TaxID=75913 RepID=A0A0K0FX34_STRVS
MLSHILIIFFYIFFINKIICYQFDIYPYEAFLPKVVRFECRSYSGRKVCAELYNFNGHPRNPDMLCKPFGHYSYRCFFSRDDYRWIENVYKPYIEKLKTDEDDPLVGSIDYDYKSYASIIRENCNQNCPIFDIEETIPIVHIPHDKSPSNFSENLIITNKYGKTIRYQKMKFIDGKEYFVEVPLQKKMFKDESYLCNERRRESVLYNNNTNPCETSVDGIEHTPRYTIPIMYNHHKLNLFSDDVFEVCNFDSDCKIIRFTIPFNFNRHSDLYKELYHKYGHLYSERVNEINADIGNYSRQWDDRYRQEYDHQKQELPRGDHNRHYSR